MKKITKAMSIMMIGGILLQPLSANALTKTETVYTTLDATGNITTSSVTNHLFIKNEQTIEDESELKEILNINGDESFTQNENKMIWNTNKKDIFYRGVIEKTQPITMDIDYYLNGEEKDVKEIIGKSGDIKIQIKFTNNLKNKVKVNGKMETLYTPFITTVGMVLDNEKNTEVEINNGKVVDSGSKNIVVGIASPGMYENFKLKELKDLDKVVITYKTEEFSLKDIYAVATPKLLEKEDLKIFDKMNTLSKSVNKLQEGMDEVEKGVKKLEKGSKSLTSGSEEISKNLKAALDGISAIKKGSNQVEEGLEKVIDKLNAVSKSLSTSEDSTQKLLYLQSMNKKAKDQLVAKTGMSYEVLMREYQTNLVNYEGTDQNLLALKSTAELIVLLESNNDAISQTLEKTKALNSQVELLLKTLTAGLEELKQGESKISSGLAEVESGLSKLYEGSKVLSNGSKTLEAGINGLTGGVEKLNKEGIQVLTKYTNEANSYSNKAKELVKLSQNYKGYASRNATNTTLVYKIKVDE